MNDHTTPQDPTAKSAPTIGSLSESLREIRNDTVCAVVMGLMLFTAGVALAATGEPEFGHGCMAGMGGMLPILALWRAAALVQRCEKEMK